jgi:spore germination protein YaaH
MLTGTSLRSGYDVLADVYPPERELPALVEEEETEDKWVKNLVPPVENVIYMAWDGGDGKLENDHIPAGVNVVTPEWFYLEEDSATGKPVAKNLLQMGKTQWNPQEYVDISHASGAKVWGMFACLGKADLARQVVSDMDIQKQVIDQLVEWTIAYNLDGISLDFEYMDPEYKEEFTQFAKNIKDALPANQNTVSAAVTVKLLGDTSGNWYQSYDRVGLAEVIDYIAVMTYDEHRSGDQTPVASITWVEKHIQRLLEEIPSNKIIMGIPFYGVDYIGKVVDSDSFNVEMLWKEDDDYRINFFSSDLQSALANSQYSDMRDRDKTIYIDYWMDKGSWSDDFGISQYSFVDTEGYLHTVYIDDESSLYQKAQLVKRYNLAGVGIWREGFGYGAMWEALADGLS